MSYLSKTAPEVYVPIAVLHLLKRDSWLSHFSGHISVMLSVGQIELPALFGKATFGGTAESSKLSSPQDKSNLSTSRPSELGTNKGLHVRTLKKNASLWQTQQALRKPDSCPRGKEHNIAILPHLPETTGLASLRSMWNHLTCISRFFLSAVLLRP